MGDWTTHQVAERATEHLLSVPRPLAIPPYAQLGAIFTKAPFGLAISDAGGVLHHYNPALQTLLGYGDEELRGIRPRDLTHPEDLPRSLALIAEIRAGRRDGYVVEKRWHHRDGSWRWVRVTLTALRDHAGALQYTIAMVEDITARHQAEVALRQSEGRSRALLENTADVIAIVAADGVRHYGNPAITRLLGYADDEAVPFRHFDLVHPDDLPALQGALHTSTAAPRVQTPVSYRLRARDGSWHHFEALITNFNDDPDIGGLVVNARDVTARKALEAQLAHWSAHDPLTGLPNRARFMARTAAALARAGARAHPVALLAIDIDRFKRINESLGPDAGDELLRVVAARLGRACHASDIVAHLNGDLFAVLLERVRDVDEARLFADRLLGGINGPCTVAGHEVVISASVGIAFAAGDATTPDRLLRDADSALGRARARGRGQVELFVAEMAAVAIKRLQLEAALRQALADEALTLHYQPQYDLRTGELVGAEVLVRWDSPEHGAIPPDDFIPLAEETGLILPLGRWVLTAACRQARQWQDALGRPIAIAVNLSAPEFQHPDLPAAIARVLTDTGLSATSLQIEITESAAVQDLDRTGATLATLRELGVGVALDDFGTGYSSLSHLQHLPVDTLKIDRSFFGPSAESQGARGRAIVPAIAALARALGLRVVAEGLETAAQIARAREAGCDLGQGYGLARPLPAAGFLAILRGTDPC
jgi:diguanylate cyclase (GGDEF)-like protein/PAS domain S-box-containing protein